MQIKNRLWIVALGLAVMVMGTGRVAAAAGEPVASAKGTQLREGMRKLWSDHVIWTREYIVAAIEGSSDAKAAAARLLKNQEILAEPSQGFMARAPVTSLPACSNNTFSLPSI